MIQGVLTTYTNVLVCTASTVDLLRREGVCIKSNYDRCMAKCKGVDDDLRNDMTTCAKKCQEYWY